MAVVGIEGQLDELCGWLWSDEGQRRVRSQLERRRLPADAQAVGAVANDVALRVMRRLERGPILGDDGTSAVERYAMGCVVNAANDGWRARRRSLEHLVAEGVADQATADDPVGDAVVAEASPLADQMREGVHAAVSPPQVWRAAAALTVITASQIEVDPSLTGPAPENGPMAPFWAGLRLAGRDDCFEQPDTTKVRNRRARAIAGVRSLLARVAETHLGVTRR